MATVIAIDPGTRMSGWAIFTDTKFESHAMGLRVVSVGLAKSNADSIAVRAAEMAHRIPYTIAVEGPILIVVERPVIYPDSKERDADQVDLAVSAGVLGGALRAYIKCGSRLLMPTPRQWKGTVPKPIHNERTAKRCPAAVELVNKLPKGQRNHVWDAVGLALWGMERIDK